MVIVYLKHLPLEPFKIEKKKSSAIEQEPIAQLEGAHCHNH